MSDHDVMTPDVPSAHGTGPWLCQLVCCGHDDGVAPDEWVAYEYAKVRRFYDRLGLGDRTAIEFFNGPHTINGVGTFDFLHQQLNWPRPEN